jgi:hypothetical protein
MTQRFRLPRAHNSIPHACRRYGHAAGLRRYAILPSYCSSQAPKSLRPSMACSNPQRCRTVPMKAFPVQRLYPALNIAGVAA